MAEEATPASDPKPTSSAVAKVKPTPPAGETLEQLQARIQQLEVENRKSKELADGYRQQFEDLKARGPAPAELKTTTTKPTLRFEVTGPPGTETFDVVDESEAKRLYCVKKQIDPSAFPLKVKCLDQDRRDALIYAQYEAAGPIPERIPGVVKKPAKKEAVASA